jgi:outer membrane protein assembly factor BamB
MAPALQGMLLRWSDRIELRHGPELASAWSRPVGAGAVQLLSADPRRLCLWYPDEGRLEVLGTADGRLWWEEADVSGRLAAIEVAQPPPAPVPVVTRAPGGRLVIAARGLPPEERGDDLQVVSGPTFAVTDVSLAVADSHGRLVVYDAGSGDLRWQAATNVRRLTHLLLDERHVVVAGMDGHGENSQPVFCIYDAATGLLKHQPGDKISSLQRLRGLALSEDGLLILVTLHHVEAFDPARLQHAWRPEAQDFKAQFAPDALWMGGDRVLVRTDGVADASMGGDLMFIEARDGRLVRRLSTRGLMDAPFQILHDSDQWLLMNADGCVALSADGAVLWQDAISDPGRLLAMAASDRHVMVLGVTTEADLLRTGERRLYMIDRPTGVITGEQRLTADADLSSIHFLGGRLLLSGEGITVVFDVGE